MKVNGRNADKAPHTTRRSPRGGRTLMVAILLVASSGTAWAQGTIFGTVQNSNATTPADTDILWWGFLDDTDEEIRIESSIGAGYSGGNWFDDFQNYSTEAAGNPYDYYFSNMVNSEGFHLAKLIPSNSFQQEDITLAAASDPAQPSGLTVRPVSSGNVLVHWNAVSGITYHVYRRNTSNNGFLRRLDDPAGSLASAGVADSFFVDGTSDGSTAYTYLIVGEDGSGNYSPHSSEAAGLASSLESPVVSGVSPTTGPVSGGTAVTVTGIGFDPDGAGVTVGGAAATGVVVVSPFEISCVTPAGSAGAADVIVTNTSSALASPALVGGFTYFAENSVPVADAGPDQPGIDAGTLVTLTGLGSSDADGDSLGYHWAQIAGPAVVLSDSNAAEPTFTPGIMGDHDFELIVDDAVDVSTPDVVRVTVNNQAPILDPIGSQVVDEGLTLEFRWTASDPDATTPTLTATNLPSNATYFDSGNGAASFTFNPDFAQAGVYDVTFLATDGALLDSEIVEITVNEAGSPQPAESLFVSSSVSSLAITSEANSHGAPDGADASISGKLAQDNESWTFDFDNTASAGQILLGADIYLTHRQSGFQNDSLIFEYFDGTGFVPFESFANVPASLTQVGPFAASAITAMSQVDGFQVRMRGVQKAGGGDDITYFVDAIELRLSLEDNLAPVLTPIGPQFVDEGQTLEFRWTATDPDATTPALTATNLPTNAAYVDSGNGAASFTFNPDFTQAGTYNVTFVASDGGLADTEIVSITVAEVGNQAPILDPIGAQSLDEGQTLEFRWTATDPDATTPTLTATNLPTNATYFDSGNGAASFTFSPDFTQAGTYNVTFVASDGGLADTEIVPIDVAEVGNQTPILDPIGSQSVDEGQTLEFRWTATDPDATTPALTATNLPANATYFDSGNGAASFTFAPDLTQSGNYDVTFIAADGMLSDTEVVAITVNNVNQRPILDPIGSQLIFEEDTLEFRWTGSDPDETTPTLTATNLPTNASYFDSGNGAASFTFSPNISQAGNYNVTFIAADGDLADSEVVAIMVLDQENRPPVLDSIGPKEVDEGQTLEFRWTGSDPDGTVPLFVAENLPTNAAYVDSGNGAASFTFSPDFTQAGVYDVTFFVWDAMFADTEIVTITVNEVGNQAPVLDPIGPQSVDAAWTLEFRWTGSDPDGTTPALTASNLPTNASYFDSGNGAASFTFNPDQTQAGVYNVTFVASDGMLADTEVVPITVNDSDHPPVLDPIGPQVVEEGQTLQFRWTGSDPDLSIPALTATNLPANASYFDSANGAASFTFSPDLTQSGVYNVTFMASDGGWIDSEVVVITVLEQENQPPVLDPIGPQSVDEGQTLEFRWTGSDPNGTVPALLVTNPPANATFVDSGNGAASFTFSPDFTQAAVYNVTFLAHDGLLADVETVVITVNDVATGCACPNQGDVAPIESDGDGVINVIDVVALIDEVFRFGAATMQDPECPNTRGDFAPAEVCGDGAKNVLDVVYLIDYVFRFGPPICDPCGP